MSACSSTDQPQLVALVALGAPAATEPALLAPPAPPALLAVLGRTRLRSAVRATQLVQKLTAESEGTDMHYVNSVPRWVHYTRIAGCRYRYVYKVRAAAARARPPATTGGTRARARRLERGCGSARAARPRAGARGARARARGRARARARSPRLTSRRLRAAHARALAPAQVRERIDGGLVGHRSVSVYGEPGVPGWAAEIGPVAILYTGAGPLLGAPAAAARRRWFVFRKLLPFAATAAERERAPLLLGTDLHVRQTPREVAWLAPAAADAGVVGPGGATAITRIEPPRHAHHGDTVTATMLVADAGGHVSIPIARLSPHARYRLWLAWSHPESAHAAAVAPLRIVRARGDAAARATREHASRRNSDARAPAAAPAAASRRALRGVVSPRAACRAVLRCCLASPRLASRARLRRAAWTARCAASLCAWSGRC
jgi:hypothetical protein